MMMIMIIVTIVMMMMIIMMIPFNKMFSKNFDGILISDSSFESMWERLHFSWQIVVIIVKTDDNDDNDDVYRRCCIDDGSDNNDDNDTNTFDFLQILLPLSNKLHFIFNSFPSAST